LAGAAPCASEPIRSAGGAGFLGFNIDERFRRAGCERIIWPGIGCKSRESRMLFYENANMGIQLIEGSRQFGVEKTS
jgi:hypothetical protein